MKKNQLEILFPNNKKIKLNLYDLLNQKIETIDELISKWGNYFEKNWDKELIIGGLPQRPVPRILDQLAYYLLWESDKNLTTKNILNHPKENKLKYTEIPVSECASNIQDYFYSQEKPKENYTFDDNIYKEYPENTNGLDKRCKRFRHLQKTNIDFIDHIRFFSYKSLEQESDINKLKDINQYICLGIKEKYNKEEKKEKIIKELLWHYDKLKYNFKVVDKSVTDKNKLLSYAKKSYKKTLTMFDKIETFKKYNIDNSIPYSSEWSIVNTVGNFKFNNKNYNIKGKYDYDRIICFEQGQKWFFDPQMNLILFYNK